MLAQRQERVSNGRTTTAAERPKSPRRAPESANLGSPLVASNFPLTQFAAIIGADAKQTQRLPAQLATASPRPSLGIPLQRRSVAGQSAPARPSGPRLAITPSRERSAGIGSIARQFGAARSHSAVAQLALIDSFKALVPEARAKKLLKKANALIDRLLPALLNALPFEHGMAAISFAEDVLEKWLHFHPEAVNDPEPGRVMREHLEGVIAGLAPKRAKQAEEEPDDEEEEDDDEEEETAHGRGDKNPLYAKARQDVAKRKAEDLKKEKAANNTAKVWAKEGDPRPELLKPLKALGLGKPASDFITELEKDKSEWSVQFLQLIANGRESKIAPGELRDEYNRLLSRKGMEAKTPRRDVRVDALVQLGALPGDQAEPLKQGAHGLLGQPRLDWEKRKEEDEKRIRDANQKKLDTETGGKADAAKKRKEKLEAERNPLLDRVSALAKAKPAAEELVAKLTKSEAQWTLAYLRTILEANEDRLGGEDLFYAYELIFAERALPPGNAERGKEVDGLQALEALGNIAPEELKLGGKTDKKIIADAIKQSWATKDEVEVVSKLIGQHALAGVIQEHMRRKKPAPLRGILEQLMANREQILKPQPPLTSQSLIVDTNIIDALRSDPARLAPDQRKVRTQVLALIARENIQDLRLANINIGELNKAGTLLGTRVTIAQGGLFTLYRKTTLPIYGVPLDKSRAGAGYSRVFNALKSGQLGDEKGSADRSMLADIYLADRAQEKGAVARPHFATADAGITEKYKKRKPDGGRVFDPATHGLAPLAVHRIGGEDAEAFEDVARPDPPKPEVSAKPDSVAPPKDDPPKVDASAKAVAKSDSEEKVEKGPSGSAKQPTAEAPKPTVKKPKAAEIVHPSPVAKDHPFAAIWNFPVGRKPTAYEIAKLIPSTYTVRAVGGALRDALRGEPINDVDLKTNMPLDALFEAVAKAGWQSTATIEQRLLKIKAGDEAIDVTCGEPHGYWGPKAFNATADARQRDFTLNALFLAPDSREIEDPLGARDDVLAGRLQFTGDPGGPDVGKRIATIVATLKAKPENFGRALKFMERGYRRWEKQAKEPKPIEAPKGRKSKQAKPEKEKDVGYHLDAEILDGLRNNAAEILRGLNEGDGAAGRKSLFLHQSGFKSPQELVAVMRRLNFPPEVVRLVLPDSVAGHFDAKETVRTYHRDVAPRDRPTGDPKDWNPSAAPQLKVDVTTGRIYQYRLYAEAPSGPADKNPEHLLIDVDMSEHGLAGHHPPHYHVYRDGGDRWVKTGHGFSNTGQPGLPPIKRRGSAAVYDGPLPWRWWDRKTKANELDNASLLEAVGKAAQLAGIKMEYDKSSRHVNFADEVKVNIARLRDLAANDRIPKLLMLVRNLSTGAVKEWTPEDESVRALTGSRGQGERLRFQRQLDQVVPFLQNKCKVPLKGPLKKLTRPALIRLFDLVNANLPPEKCQPAAAFALKRATSPLNFVDHFEFYLASSANQFALTQVGDALAGTEAAMQKAGAISDGVEVKGTGSLEEEVRKNADKLTFERPVAAAYHLQKHVEHSPETVKKFHTEKGREELAAAYIAEARAAIKSGKVRHIHDDQGADIFNFTERPVLTVVRVVDGRASILTSYHEDQPAPLRIALQFLSARAEASGKPMPPLPTEFNTPFGRLRRGTTLGDGNCLFRALRESGALAQSAATLREMAVNELVTNWQTQHYDRFLVGGGSAEQAISAATAELGRNGSWDTQYGDLAPHLIGRALNRPIHVLSARDGSLIHTVGGNGGAAISVFYNGGHYDRAERIV